MGEGGGGGGGYGSLAGSGWGKWEDGRWAEAREGAGCEGSSRVGLPCRISHGSAPGGDACNIGPSERTGGPLSRGSAATNAGGGGRTWNEAAVASDQWRREERARARERERASETESERARGWTDESGAAASERMPCRTVFVPPCARQMRARHEHGRRSVERALAGGMQDTDTGCVALAAAPACRHSSSCARL